MQGFSGFPPGKTRFLRVPSLFFGELLPIIDHLGEMKVTLYFFWALQQQEGQYKYVRRTEIEDDELFMSGLSKDKAAQKAGLEDALERAVARGTLLHVTLRMVSESVEIYFMNTADGRNAVRAIEEGRWIPGDGKRPIELIIERPNIFTLYEQNMGGMTPYIADQLRQAEQDYPEVWIVEAIQLAIENNARNWRYVAAILERWTNEGRQHGFAGRRHSQTESSKPDYSDIIES